MKTKQALAAAFAAVMVFSTAYGTPVMAEEIDGGTIYVDQEVIDVTLPTTASQKFYVDPQGLIAIGKGGADVANAGTVVGASNMYAVNRSSIPLALSVSYKLVDSATTDGVTVVDTVADNDAATAIQNDAAKKIAVSVSAVESATDADASGNDCGGNVFKEVAAGVDMTDDTGKLATADAVYAKSTTAAEAAYLMTAETYKAQLKDGKTAADAYDSSAYEYVVDTTAKKASCVKFAIGGYCSTKADWSDYADGTETLKLDVTFKFKKLTTDAGDYTDAKVGTEEVVLGPQVTLSTSGLITISNLTSDANVADGTKDITLGINGDMYVFTANEVEWDTSEWSEENGGTLKIQLKSGYNVYNGKAVKVSVELSDGSTIDCTETITIA